MLAFLVHRYNKLLRARLHGTHLPNNLRFYPVPSHCPRFLQNDMTVVEFQLAEKPSRFKVQFEVMNTLVEPRRPGRIEFEIQKYGSIYGGCTFPYFLECEYHAGDLADAHL